MYLSVRDSPKSHDSCIITPETPKVGLVSKLGKPTEEASTVTRKSFWHIDRQELSLSTSIIVDMVSDLVTNKSTLESLDIISLVAVHDIKKLADAIRVNCSLKSLQLVVATENDLKYLCEALKTNRILNYLELRLHSSSCSDISILTNMLQVNKTLSHLIFRGYKFKDEDFSRKRSLLEKSKQAPLARIFLNLPT